MTHAAFTNDMKEMETPTLLFFIEGTNAQKGEFLQKATRTPLCLVR